MFTRMVPMIFGSAPHAVVIAMVTGLFGNLSSAPAWGADSFLLQAKLNREAALLEEIKPYVERQDLPTLLVLSRAAQRVSASLSTNGPAHMETLQGFQELVISTRFSKELFAVTSTARTRAQVAEIQTIGRDIAQATGFDQVPYTRITASVYHQVYDLTLRLLALDLPAPLRAQTGNLQPALGRLLAVAGEGDHARTFERGIEVQRQIAAMYPLFDAVAGSDSAFLIVLEIQGLNEYYAQFARTEK